MNKFAKIGCAVAVALGMSSVAQAGKFEVWSDESGKAGQTIAVVSFAGDGVTQDAQLDMTYAENLQFVSASVKVPGSVCVVFQDQRLMRVVPPSGAGFTPTRLATSAAVTVESDGPGFKISRSALKLEASVPNIARDQFQKIAEGAKTGCPVSKVLNAEITLDWQLA